MHVSMSTFSSDIFKCPIFVCIVYGYNIVGYSRGFNFYLMLKLMIIGFYTQCCQVVSFVLDSGDGSLNCCLISFYLTKQVSCT